MKYINKSLTILDLDDELVNFLNEKGLFTVEDIWVLKRTELKKMGAKDNQINQLCIKLQLLGLDLNKKVYKVKI